MLERDETSPDEWSNQDGALMTVDQSFFSFGGGLFEALNSITCDDVIWLQQLPSSH